MQVWIPGADPRDDGEFETHLNPGSGTPFAVIELSEDRRTALCMQSVGECDRLIRAATKARQLLATATAREGEAR